MSKPPRDGRPDISVDTTQAITDSQIVEVKGQQKRPPPRRDPEVSMWAGSVVVSEEFQPALVARRQAKRKRKLWLAGAAAVALALAAGLLVWRPWAVSGAVVTTPPAALALCADAAEEGALVISEAAVDEVLAAPAEVKKKRTTARRRR
jgi:hypothetical protein